MDIFLRNSKRVAKNVEWNLWGVNDSRMYFYEMVKGIETYNACRRRQQSSGTGEKGFPPKKFVTKDNSTVFGTSFFIPLILRLYRVWRLHRIEKRAREIRFSNSHVNNTHTRTFHMRTNIIHFGTGLIQNLTIRRLV